MYSPSLRIIGHFGDESFQTIDNRQKWTFQPRREVIRHPDSLSYRPESVFYVYFSIGHYIN